MKASGKWFGWFRRVPLRRVVGFEDHPRFRWQHFFTGVTVWRNVAVGVVVRKPKVST